MKDLKILLIRAAAVHGAVPPSCVYETDGGTLSPPPPPQLLEPRLILATDEDAC